MAKCSQRKIQRRRKKIEKKQFEPGEEKNADQVEKKGVTTEAETVWRDHVGHYRATNTCAILYYIVCRLNSIKSQLFCPSLSDFIIIVIIFIDRR